MKMRCLRIGTPTGEVVMELDCPEAIERFWNASVESGYRVEEHHAGSRVVKGGRTVGWERPPIRFNRPAAWK